MNPYDILGVRANATLEEIINRYKSLAQKHHPDKGGSEEMFKRIKEAYELLADPERRRRYDSTGDTSIPIPLRDEALEQLRQLFFNILNGSNPDVDDLVVRMKVEANKAKDNVIRDLLNCRQYIQKLEKAIKKIKRKKGNGDNLFVSFAQMQREICLKDVAMFERRLQICDAMRSILEDYQYGELTELLTG